MTSWLGDFESLRQHVAGFKVLPETVSTNDELKSPALTDYVAVLTDHQTAGRGRMGRTWVSNPGQGLAFSLLVPQASPAQQQWLPLVVGASLVASLRNQGVLGAHLKWPNDVLVDDGKLAGILCELRQDGRVIVGIGINLDYPTVALPSEQAVSLTTFGEVSHESIDSLLANTVSTLREYLEMPMPQALILARDRVRGVLATLGREVSVYDLQGAVWTGLATGLSDEGHLVVRESVTGEERIVVASDVQHLRQ